MSGEARNGWSWGLREAKPEVDMGEYALDMSTSQCHSQAEQDDYMKLSAIRMITVWLL